MVGLGCLALDPVRSALGRISPPSPMPKPALRWRGIDVPPDGPSEPPLRVHSRPVMWTLDGLSSCTMRSELISSIAFLAVSFVAPSAIAQAIERGAPSCSSEKIAAARDGAARNLPASVYMLARYYSTGKCFAGNGAEAISLYHRAADLDYPPASFNLGLIEAANQDFGAAEASWLRGAELGHRGCELMLGTLYSSPQLAIGDDVKSYAWLSLAASPGGAGLSGLDDMLRKVTARLKPADLSKAQEDLRAMRTKYRAIPAFRH